MLIVEGCDGSGKSVLVAQLKEDLGLPVSPRVVSSNAEALVDMVKWTEHNLADGFQRKIFDRHRLISGMIYAPLLRGFPDPGFDDYFWLEQQQHKFRNLSPIVVICIPPLETVRDNIRNDNSNHKLFPNRKAVDQLYWLYFNWAASHAGTLIYNYTRPQEYAVLRSYLTIKLKGVKR